MAPSRRQRYAEAMAAAPRRATLTTPTSPSLYALALLGTTVAQPDRLRRRARRAQRRRSPAARTQTRVGEILAGVLAAHPRHPGALHYLLHDYDDPAHARLGLDAARAYAKVAPQSSHALHMPAHIFLQLGHVGRRRGVGSRGVRRLGGVGRARKGLPPAMRSYHSLAWRQYELLQLGRVSDAARAHRRDRAGGRGHRRPDPAERPGVDARAAGASRPRHWDGHGQASATSATSTSCARSASARRARATRRWRSWPAAGLAARATAPQEGDLRPAIAIMERQVAALIALAGGRGDEAVRDPPRGDARRAGAAAAARPADPDHPGAGAARRGAARTAATGRGARGVRAGAGPQRQPHALGARLGPGRGALGQADAARRHYQAVLANYDKADADRPELAEVRAGAVVRRSAGRRRLPRWPLLPIAAGDRRPRRRGCPAARHSPPAPQRPRPGGRRRRRPGIHRGNGSAASRTRERGDPKAAPFRPRPRHS